jgi:hypothetical protein
MRQTERKCGNLLNGLDRKNLQPAIFSLPLSGSPPRSPPLNNFT